MSKWLKKLPDTLESREEFIQHLAMHEVADNVWIPFNDSHHSVAWEIRECDGNCKDVRCKGWRLEQVEISTDSQTEKVIRAFIDGRERQEKERQQQRQQQQQLLRSTSTHVSSLGATPHTHIESWLDEKQWDRKVDKWQLYDYED